MENRIRIITASLLALALALGNTTVQASQAHVSDRIAYFNFLEAMPNEVAGEVAGRIEQRLGMTAAEATQFVQFAQFASTQLRSTNQAVIHRLGCATGESSAELNELLATILDTNLRKSFVLFEVLYGERTAMKLANWQSEGGLDYGVIARTIDQELAACPMAASL